MEFTIKNFGPISEAVIDLSKDLIIITGENNSGKTFAANLIYSLFNLQYKAANTKLPEFKKSYHKDELGDELIIKLNLAEYFELNKGIFEEQILETIKKDISKDFLVSKEYIEETTFNIQFNDYFKYIILKYIYEALHEEDVHTKYHQYVDFLVSKEINDNMLTVQTDKIYEDLVSLEDIMQDILFHASFRMLFNNTFIIPAERQGINLFTRDLTLYKTKIYDILTQLNIDKSTKLLGKLQENIGRYSKPVTDHIDFIAGLSSTNGHKTAFYDLVIDFEKEAIDGHIAVSEQGEIKFMTEGLELGTNSMSSTVKSLSSLMYYLKYKAKKGDFILIDEPELNLHQDNQVKLAKFLAKLTNMGIKILISTHSDYMIRVFNDLIMLNHIQTRDKSQASELTKYNGYQADEVLDHKNMAVYLFRKKKKVSAVHIDETGFEISTIDEVVRHINETSNEIYAEL